jgi:hypothetical protein
MKEPNQPLIDLMKQKAVNTLVCANEAGVGYCHLARLRQDKALTPRYATVVLLASVLGNEVFQVYPQVVKPEMRIQTK